MLYEFSGGLSGHQHQPHKVVGIGLSLKSTVNSRVLGLSRGKCPGMAGNRLRRNSPCGQTRKQNCDAIGMNNFKSLQQLVLKSWLMNGDCFDPDHTAKADSA